MLTPVLTARVLMLAMSIHNVSLTIDIDRGFVPDDEIDKEKFPHYGESTDDVLQTWMYCRPIWYTKDGEQTHGPGFYTVDLYQALELALDAFQIDRSFARLLYLATDGYWNDVEDWCKEILDEDDPDEDEDDLDEDDPDEEDGLDEEMQ